VNIPKEESEVSVQVIKNKKKFKKIKETIKPVCHIMVGERAFHVAVNEQAEKDILTILINHENAYQDNDNKNWYKLDYVMHIYKEEFND
jgi:hypothetical protein